MPSVAMASNRRRVPPERVDEARRRERVGLVLLVRLDDERHGSAALRGHGIGDGQRFARALDRGLSAVADEDDDVGRRQEMPPARRQDHLTGHADDLAEQRDPGDRACANLHPVEEERASVHLARRMHFDRALRAEELRELPEVGGLARARDSVVDDADAQPLLERIEQGHEFTFPIPG